ncbi:HAMP domain-containing sensor histidine kinase [Pseudomonas sp. 148P]|uniref:histidine kinase n=1 Tax=Pseudomonas ulcerans TaxID=3115852 RepID=A0ABU7HQ16_9PSED|nr:MULTISPECIES: HAMP domain-containing sensor histidine kinase [unclassified Pseudomonas]MEE1922627.1 HAMP domain-containing sensor histidine kinase [Pseudomonas sp. 147P]MEE1933604.1 HAMP domain-containing sensor histidine kinase [Pseudomonas sp. 148P]
MSRWPRSLASRLSLIFFASLVLAHGLTFAMQTLERYSSAKTLMLSNFEQDIDTSVAILERLPAAERPAWLQRLQRPNYSYRLDQGEAGRAMDDEPVSVKSIKATLGARYDLSFRDIPDIRPHYQAHLRFADGQPLTLDVRPSIMPLSPWLPLVLLGQLALLLVCTWLAVRIALRPLTHLATAVDNLDLNRPAQPLAEHGPTEVARAAVAFNAMQERIAAYVKERVQLLAAISHDLQTPITRMKLRVEFMDDGADKDKLWGDLDEIQHLVKEGVAYARSTEPSTEAASRLQLTAFLESLVFDYRDIGKPVTLEEAPGNLLLVCRPQALRRLLTNLVDNALKFAGEASLRVETVGGRLSIQVLDRGPGIPEEALGEVLKPFFRLENSRNRDTGGTGLGLAIAAQLAASLGGELKLSNREGGGLCAEVSLV